MSIETFVFKAPASACTPCERHFDNETGIRPTEETFNKYIPFFLSDLPDENCAKAGRAAYAPGMNFISDDNNEHFVKDSYFMSYHTTVITSEQFYTSLKKARELSDSIEKTFRDRGLDLKVFPYSIFYVYYEQYLTIWVDALVGLGSSLVAVFVVTFIITGESLNLFIDLLTKTLSYACRLGHYVSFNRSVHGVLDSVEHGRFDVDLEHFFERNFHRQLGRFSRYWS